VKVSKVIPLLFVLLSFLISAVSYFSLSLPEEIAIHWGLSGNSNLVVKKEIALAIFPVILVGVYLGLTVLRRRVALAIANPERDIRKNFFLSNVLACAVVVACQLFIIANASGYKVDAVTFGYYIIAIIMILVGNYAVKNVQDDCIGLKNQWVRTCNDTAKEMNKLFGRLFFFGGIVFLLFPLIVHSNLMAIEVAYIVFSAIYLQVASRQSWNKHNPGK